MRLDVTLARVLIGNTFIEIVIELEIYCIYKVVLLIIYVAVCNLLEASNFIA
jgi:hypothetical protein